MNPSISEIRETGLRFVQQHNYTEAVTLLLNVLSVDSSWYIELIEIRFLFRSFLRDQLLGVPSSPTLHNKLLDLFNGIVQDDIELITELNRPDYVPKFLR